MSRKPVSKPARESSGPGNTAEATRAVERAISGFSDRYFDGNDEGDARERTRFRLEKWLAGGVALNVFLTIGLLIAGVIQTYYGGQQVRASQDQLRVMGDTERRQLRAYVGMAPGDVEDFGVEGKQRIRFVRKNYGSTPAYNVGYSKIGLGIIHPGQSIDTGQEGCAQPLINRQLTLFPTVELPWTVVIGKNENVKPGSAEVLTGVFSREQIQLVKSGDMQFVYWGTVCYHDAFGAPHFTNYCWIYKGQSMTTKDADACLQHNDSD